MKYLTFCVNTIHITYAFKMSAMACQAFWRIVEAFTSPLPFIYPKSSSSFNLDSSMSSISSSMVQLDPLFPLVSIFIMKQTIIWQLTSKLTFFFPMFTSSSLSSTQESSTMPHTSLKKIYSTENKVLWQRKKDLFSTE